MPRWQLLAIEEHQKKKFYFKVKHFGYMTKIESNFMATDFKTT